MSKIEAQAEEDVKVMKKNLKLDKEQEEWVFGFLVRVRAESKLAGMQLALGMLEEKDENGTVTG